MIDATNELGGGLGTLPWLVQITMLIPTKLNPLARVLLYSQKCVDDRKTRKPEEPDVLSHILEAGPFFEDPKTDDLLLLGDARLLIVAGSDTTATTLIYAFYHFARDPKLVQKLRDELKQHNITKKEDIVDIPALQHLEFLEGIINETLRLHPPVPGGVFRSTPAGGAEIGGHFLPGGVKVIGPHYTIQRCKSQLFERIPDAMRLIRPPAPRAFVKPNAFIPERWTTEPELILKKDAWFPFSMGRFSCKLAAVPCS